MVDIESVGRTAFLISELRAEEAERTPRLFDDPYARLFSSPGSKAAIQRAHGLGPLFSAALRVRIRWFDDLLQRELEGGVRQVLLLGAGMDCRALRFARAGVRYFEVDAPGVLAFKAERLASAGQAPGAVAVGVDYLAPGLMDRLAEHGFDAALHTLVLWEGNHCYLPPDQARSLLQLVARSIPDVHLAFDYFGLEVIEGRSRIPSLNQATAMLRFMGAPWICGVADLEAMAREANLRVLEHVTMAEVMQRLLPDPALREGYSAEVGYALLGGSPSPRQNAPAMPTTRPPGTS
jgi:methyltransferase (TIGR00027 family)